MSDLRKLQQLLGVAEARLAFMGEPAATDSADRAADRAALQERVRDLHAQIEALKPASQERLPYSEPD